MKKGTRVSWQIAFAPNAETQAPYTGRGSGLVISDEQDGMVLVRVNSLSGEPNQGYHAVISCTVTWLTVE